MPGSIIISSNNKSTVFSFKYSTASSLLTSVYEKDYITVPIAAESHAAYHSIKDLQAEMKKLKKQMLEAARELEFEKAAELRDRLLALEKESLELAGS